MRVERSVVVGLNCRLTCCCWGCDVVIVVVIVEVVVVAGVVKQLRKR